MTRFLGLLGISFIVMNCATRPFPQARAPRALSNLGKIRAKVVIDPGHGGKDSGALSPLGLREKDLSLDIALRIRRLIRLVMPEVAVVMTRQSDTYVSLEERIKIANEAKGDLFISVHINSSENKDAKGFEIYSLDIAGDRHAERLAARENKNFGVDKGVNFILADLRANDHRGESDQLARFISKSLSTQIAKKVGQEAVNDRGYNQAIFHVLFVKMPAVLTELGFLSNPDDQKALETEAMRESYARGITAGLAKYLDNRIVRAQNATKPG